MAMVVESSTQFRGCAEHAHDVRMVVKHTFLELVVEDDFGVRSMQNARRRSSSEPRTPMHMVQFDKCEMERKSAASTQANDTDDDDTELMLSDDEEPTTRVQVQAPPGVWAQQPQQCCVVFVPVMQQPVWKKSSRSARRRRARAMNRWFRYNMQGEQQEGAFDDDESDAEFDDEWQLPEGEDAESPEMDAESWPMTNSPSEVVQDKKKA